ncbi:MAG: prepilin-type N-terminal cleavage/methylation domain-containing protein [Eubacteriales bacterium]|nr:prepilin-type N-terminal cleavage/methylation domain-containing protein [Eubacteriales bacterium]
MPDITRHRNRKLNKGFTLIEIIVVIAIIGILSAISLPRLSGFNHLARSTEDHSNLRLLNVATAIYRASPNTFDTRETDQKKMQALVAANLINKELKPIRYDYVFTWNQSEEQWYLSNNNLSVSSSIRYDFLTMFNKPEPFKNFILNRENSTNATITEGEWEFDENGYLKSIGSMRNLLYTENPYDEYSIIANAKLSENSSGYGILFDSKIENGRDIGYILQYETYRDSSGNQAGVRMVVRERYVGENGQQKESGYLSLIESNRGNEYRITLANDSSVFDMRNIEIRVSNHENENLRKMTAYLDGEEIFHFNYNSTNGGYTGLRTWDTTWGSGEHRKSFKGDEVRFKDLEIIPKQ